MKRATGIFYLVVVGSLLLGGCGSGEHDTSNLDLDVSNPEPVSYDDAIVFREVASEEIAPEKGGVIEVTDAVSPLFGIKLSIPAEAFSSKQMIILSEVDNPPPLPDGFNYIGMPIDLHPEGLSFHKKVTIELPYTDAELSDAGVSDDAALQVFSYDKASGLWEKVTIVTIDTVNNKITAELNHFSIVARTGFNATPPADLGTPQPGDLLYKTGFLAFDVSAKGWRPGHVGIYTGEKLYPGVGLASESVRKFGVYNVIEALGDGVQYSYYDIPNITETHGTDLDPFEHKATFMGAREPIDVVLTPTQRETIVTFVEEQIGKEYAVKQTFGSALGYLPGPDVKGQEQYNCIGLAEKAYEVAGVNGGEGLVSTANEERLLTPAEQYNQTKPAGGEQPIPTILSATITPDSGTECTDVLAEITVSHNYGGDFIASVTYKTDSGYSNPELNINDQGSQGDKMAQDGVFSVLGDAGGSAEQGSIGINFTLTDVYGKTDTAKVVYTFTGTCEEEDKE